MHSFLYLLLTLAILVVVHEYGHFWVARRCGVKVLKFSVGFGKPLWRRLGKDGTEYVVSAIPLGGFVKMLDEREGEVEKDELDRAFNRKPLRARVAIVAAGPIANLLFAIIAYWFIFMIGIPGLKPIIGEVIPNSAASYAALTAGDEIKTVNDRNTPTWRSVNRALSKIAETGGKAELTIKLDDSDAQRELIVPKQEIDTTSSVSLLQSLGIKPVEIKLKPVIAKVVDHGAAQQADLQAGDLIIAVGEKEIDSWSDLVNIVQVNPNKKLNFIVERKNKQIELVITPTKSADNVGKIGVMVDSGQTVIADDLKAVERYGIIDALGRASYQTWSFSVATLKSLAGMLLGNVSSKNIGGPIAIAQYAGASADRGLVSFVSFLAMISISLGLLNLLPIPVLDGGHLAFYLVEWIRGKPLAENVQFQVQKVGIVLLVMLMFLAFFNDLTRVFG